MQLQSAVPFIGILLLSQTTTQLAPQQYHLINLSLSWSEARHFCRVKYADLATVNNMGDNDRLLSALGGHVTPSWIGLQRGKAERWMWSDGRGPARFTKWDEGEPNNKNVEHCVEIDGDGFWNNDACGKKKGSVCYERRQDGKERYVHHSAENGWLKSQQLCRTRHTDLAYISTELENSDVAKEAKNWDTNLWIGLFYDAWMWSDGGQTSFRFWLSGGWSGGDCAAVAAPLQGRWGEVDCSTKTTFVCQGDLKVKRMVIRIEVDSDADLTDSTHSDALLEKMEADLKQQGVTDFKLRWRTDDNGDIFKRQEQEVPKKTGEDINESKCSL